MLLHIGENQFLNADRLIMILNADIILQKDSATNLRSSGGTFKKISKNRTKSIIVQDDNRVFESPIDSLTLYKRDDVLLFFKKEEEKSS